MRDMHGLITIRNPRPQNNAGPEMVEFQCTLNDKPETVVVIAERETTLIDGNLYRRTNAIQMFVKRTRWPVLRTDRGFETQGNLLSFSPDEGNALYAFLDQ